MSRLKKNQSNQAAPPGARRSVNTEAKQRKGGSRRPVKTGEKQVAPSLPPKPLSAAEQAQMDAQRAQLLAMPRRPEVTFREEGGKRIMAVGYGLDDDRQKLHGVAFCNALGSWSDAFIEEATDTLCGLIHTEGAPSSRRFNAALATMAAIAPENELEAMIGFQIVGADVAARKCLKGMASSEWVDQHKLYGDLANKFMRTSAALIEALAKLRRGGEQVVKHVHVHEGGQAVVADTFNHNQGGGALGGSNDQSHATEAAAGVAALPGPDAEGYGVPISGHAERSLSDARRD